MYYLFELSTGKFDFPKCECGLFVNQDVKLSQVIPVYNAELYEVGAAADFQFFANPSLVVFDAFPLNNEACGYFGRGEAVGYEREYVPFAVGELE